MVRFKIAFNIGEGLEPSEVTKEKAQEIKIIDIMGELPDLIVKNEKAAREYINYFNQPAKEKEIERYINGVKADFERYADISSSLILPEKEIVSYDEDDNPVYKRSLREQLFYDGYLQEVNRTRGNINGKLSALRNLLCG